MGSYGKEVLLGADFIEERHYLIKTMSESDFYSDRDVEMEGSFLRMAEIIENEKINGHLYEYLDFCTDLDKWAYHLLNDRDSWDRYYDKLESRYASQRMAHNNSLHDIESRTNRSLIALAARKGINTSHIRIKNGNDEQYRKDLIKFIKKRIEIEKSKEIDPFTVIYVVVLIGITAISVFVNWPVSFLELIGMIISYGVLLFFFLGFMIFG